MKWLKIFLPYPAAFMYGILIAAICIVSYKNNPREHCRDLIIDGEIIGSDCTYENASIKRKISLDKNSCHQFVDDLNALETCFKQTQNFANEKLLSPNN